MIRYRPEVLSLVLAMVVIASCAGDAGVGVPVAPLPAAGLDVAKTERAAGLEVGSRVGQEAPNFRLEDEEGRVVDLSDFRGIPVLLNFWATWCGPCRREMPEFQKASEFYGGKLAVVGVNASESPSLVWGFRKELGLTYQTPIDRGNKVSAAYNVFGLPATYLIDREGIVLVVKIGPFLDWDDLRQTLQPAGL